MPERIEHNLIHELRLNRPPANALDPDSVCALTRMLREAPSRGARGVVISGTPGMFCAGLDVPLLLQLDRAGITRFWASFYTLLRVIAESEIPVACALTGHAPAGGTVLAAFCDFRVMAEGSYKMGFNEVRVGLPVPYPIYVAFELACGTRIAARYSTEGRILDGAHAREIGLVDELAAADQVIPRALDWCRQVAALPANAVATTRRYAREKLVAAFDRNEAQPETIGDIWFSAETQDALRALTARLRK